MPHGAAWFVVAAAAVLSLPATTRGNDGAFGGNGSMLSPVSDTPISMASESIALTLGATHDEWTVVADYEFVNPTDRVVAVQMGFPESRCAPPEGMEELCVGGGGAFRGLQTKVRGVAVGHRVGQVRPSDPWAKSLGKVHLFDVSFAPREKVVVTHRYDYGVSSNNLGLRIRYLTRTGGLWSGPIGRARFTVELPFRPLGFAYDGEYTLVSYGYLPGAEHGERTRIVLEREGWRPTSDFGLAVVDSRVSSVVIERMGFDPANCSPLEDLEDADVLTDFAQELVSNGFREYWRTDELEECLRWAEAIHGAPIDDAAAAAQYYRKIAARDTDYGSLHEGRAVFVGLVADPLFDARRMSKAERVFVDAMRGELARRRRAARETGSSTPDCSESWTVRW
jgi:hypothetical protein